MKKLILALTLFAFLAGGLAAAPKELSVLWFYDDPSELEFLKKACEDYKAKVPGLEFKINTVPYADLNSKIAQLVAGGTPPDVVKMTDYRAEVAPFIQDLSKSLGKDFLAPFIPGIAAIMNREGKIIGAPLDVTANGIILNKSLFDKAGVRIPDQKTAWTYAEFLKAITKVRDSAGVKFPLVWDVTPHRWLTFLFQNGAQVFTPDGKGNAFNSPATLATFRAWGDFFKNGIIPQSTWGGTENPRDLFFSGQAVAWMSGSWQVKAMSGIKDFAWTAGPNPYVTTRSSVLGYKYVTGFSTSKYPAEAAQFIKYFTSKEVNSAYAKALMTISSRTDTGTIDYGSAQASSALNALAYELAISPVAASTNPSNPAMSLSYDRLKESIINVTIGKSSPEEAVAAVSKVIDEALAATSKK
ncbi:MAG TPA: sugar ABC transporter substrate-binding protein [Spirochaetales bacterium]|nr:sugar ABC transporter substrate-binding protein [Spirochaetales bacterium]HRY56159.1 sugar ABC transporter substrate-binding protein [Spirochaetia bacterium]HRZ65630.1 sugar ABC transporter substrate-binding protein [Spirochaetia bacterium]